MTRSTIFVYCPKIHLEPALQTNGVTESYMKEVVKKLLKKALKQKGGEKNANDANDMINTTSVD